VPFSLWMPVVANEVTAPDRKAVIFQVDLPFRL